MSRYFLECAGKSYDGCDHGLYEFCKNLGILDKFEHERIIDDGSGKFEVSIKPGQPLHFITTLGAICREAIQDRNKKIIENIPTLMLSMRHWIDQQRIKLQAMLDKPSQEKTEFHYAREVFSEKSADFALFGTLQNLTFIIIELYINNLYCDGLIQYCNSLKALGKVIRKALDKDPELSRIKHKQKYKAECCDFLDFYSKMGILDTLITTGEYLRAEAFLNKMIFLVERIYKSWRLANKYLLYSIQALLSAKNDDVEFVLRTLKQRKKYKKEMEKALSEGTNDYTRAVPHYSRKLNCNFEVFYYLAGYYRDKGEIHQAIRYYEMARHNAHEFVSMCKAKKQLEECHPEYLMQLAQFAQKYSTIVKNVKVYKKHMRIDLYFQEKKYTDQFFEIMKSKDESPQRAKVPKTDDEKSLVAFIIAVDFSFENFRVALERVKATFKRDEAKKLKGKAEESDTPKKPSEAEPHIDYAELISSTSLLYKRSGKRKGKQFRNTTASTNTKTEKKVEKMKLDCVHFTETNKLFDPEAQTNVVTLNVNGMTQRWYAFLNPELLKLIPQEEEANKLFRKFSEGNVLSGDMCVPCYKEFSGKTYVFKIRLLGHGKGDIRIYAEHVETVGNKKLVVFTAINTKAHTKGSQPKYIPLAEQIEKESKVCAQ